MSDLKKFSLHCLHQHCFESVPQIMPTGPCPQGGGTKHSTVFQKHTGTVTDDGPEPASIYGQVLS